MKLFRTKLNKVDCNSIVEVLRAGDLGFGPNVNLLESEYSEYSNKEYNIAVNSASAAAFMLFAYLKEKYGSCDVYTPSLGFTSPAWAAKHHGHNLIWVEVNEDLLFDIEDYRQKRRLRCERYTDVGIKPVLMPVLYGGVSNIKEFDTLQEDNYNELIIVDSAHCATPSIKADYTFFSFHPFKPIAASDGGMISTNDHAANKWLRSYRNFGREVIGDTYDISMDGFKFYMNNLNATIALTQLSRYEENLTKRKATHTVVEGLELEGRLLPHDAMSSYYFDTLICNEDSLKHLLLKFPTSKHYPLLHQTKYFKDGTSLPYTEKIHKFILNLPLYDTDIYNS